MRGLLDDEEGEKRQQEELERCRLDLEHHRRYHSLMMRERERTEEDKEFISSCFKEYDKAKERRPLLVINLKNNLAELKELYDRKVGNTWCYDDLMYRFYHQSLKVYWLQPHTVEIVAKLRSMAPEGVRLNQYFLEILEQGTGKVFAFEHNQEWLKHARPIVEAFLHAKYFLEMAIKTGENIEGDPRSLASYYAGLLYFYNLR